MGFQCCQIWPPRLQPVLKAEGLKHTTLTGTRYQRATEDKPKPVVADELPKEATPVADLMRALVAEGVRSGL